MSFKVYTGIGFGTSTADTAVFLLGGQKAAIQALVDTKQRRLLAKMCAERIDSYCLARHAGKELPPELEKDKDTSVLVSCAMQVMDRQVQCRKSLERDPEIDCDVLIRLFGDPGTRRLVGLVAEERVGAYAHLLKTPGIEEYSFWDNVDPPENVPRRKWLERGRIWNAATSSKGFELSTSWEPSFAKLDEVVPHLPTFDDRVRTRARNRAINEFVTSSWSPRAPEDMSGLMAAATKAREQLSEAGSPLAQRCEAYARELEAVLLPDLSGLLNTTFGQLPVR